VVMERLDQLTPFAQEAWVVFDTATGRQTAELRLHLSGGQLLVAGSEADDHRTALDRAEAKLRRQLEKPVAKPRRTRRSSARKP
jgi:ribosome-associated translation inhibitor RaiA